MKIWAKTKEFSDGKYLVVRRDGTTPNWPHFVLGGDDPSAPFALRAYADHAQHILGLDPEYVASIRELADDFAARTGGKADPAAPPHRTDLPLVIAMMRRQTDVATMSHVIAELQAENDRLRALNTPKVLCYWDADDRGFVHSSPSNIFVLYDAGSIAQIEHLAVVRTTYEARLPAADDADSDDDWKVVADTMEEAEAAVAAERARRELAYEIATRKEQADSDFAALDLCNSDASKAVLLDLASAPDITVTFNGGDDDSVTCEGCGRLMKPEDIAWRYLDDPEFCAACAPTPEQREAERKECREANTDGNKFKCFSLENCRADEKCQAEAAELVKG